MQQYYDFVNKVDIWRLTAILVLSMRAVAQSKKCGLVNFGEKKTCLNSANSVGPIWHFSQSFSKLGLGNSSHEYNTVYSGNSYNLIPSGVTPWLTATFVDTGNVLNPEVTLTLQAYLSGAASQFVSNWYFNYTGAYPLTFTTQTGTAPTAIKPASPIHESIWTTPSSKADGDGNFDIVFSFPDANNVNRFDGTENAAFKLSGPEGFDLTAAMFSALSFDKDEKRTGLETAAHIQGIPIPESTDTTSVWVTTGQGTVVPIPAAAWLLGSGLIGLVAIRRRFKK